MDDSLVAPPRRGRPKALSDAHQRDRVLTALHQVLAEKGYAGTTMDLVATTAGLSKKTLYALFDSKEQVFGALVDQHRTSILDLPRAVSDQPLADELAAIFRLDLDPAQAKARHAILEVMIAEALRHPELRGVLDIHGPFAAEALLSQWLSRECQRGRLVLADPADAAAILMGMMFSVLVPKPFETDMQASEALPARRGRLAIDIFLNGTERPASRH